VRRIRDAIFGDPKRLDRDLWLSRFSDLMLNGIQFSANSPIDLAAWRRAVREGECGIHMRGYSHIFVSGPSDASECSDFVTIAEAEESWQEVFSRARLREVVTSYWKASDPTPIRKAIAGEDIWKTQTYRTPSKRIQIVQRRTKDGDSSNEGEAPGEGPHGPQPLPVQPATMPPSSSVSTPSEPSLNRRRCWEHSGSHRRADTKAPFRVSNHTWPKRDLGSRRTGNSRDRRRSSKSPHSPIGGRLEIVASRLLTRKLQFAHRRERRGQQFPVSITEVECAAHADRRIDREWQIRADAKYRARNLLHEHPRTSEDHSHRPEAGR
jgi:hypothetical protein